MFNGSSDWKLTIDPCLPPCFVAGDFLSVDDDALVVEPLTDQKTIESVAAPAANELGEDEGDDAEVTEPPPPTINDARGALSTLQHFIENRTSKDNELPLQYICAVSDLVDDARLTQLRQTSFLDNKTGTRYTVYYLNS